MPQIKWTEDLVLGIEKFDAHHEHLITLINETTICLENGAPQEEVTIILNSLLAYAWYHFNAEEKWMKEQHYPKLEEQQNTHKEFSDKIKELQGQLTDRNNTVAAELSTYLNFWLIDHIVISDSQYATFAGLRKEPVLMT